MQPRMMSLAGRQRARVGIVGIYVVAVDRPGARSGGRAQQELNGAVAAREFSPGAGAVDGSVCHELSPAVTLPLRDDDALLVPTERLVASTT